ncbi:MAG: 6-phosphofructokinase [Clostridia bacterium]|nr:6-phosphofructokinase [Clostridia bacterium]MDD4666163.1 6-phosphofructokinase [Clostridia bacterium]
MKKIALLTSGGDAPGMNAAIRAVVRTSIYYGVEVVGVRRGYTGLIEKDFLPLNLGSVADIIQRGGTILLTARCDEFYKEEGRAKALVNIKEEGIEGLIAIGGDGTFRGALELEKAGVPVIGIPGTIDNDIPCTSATIGFDTVVNTVLDAINKIRDTATSHERIFVIEVMGRKSGFIALEAGLAGGAESIMIPEFPLKVDDIINNIQRGLNRGKKHSIILIAEGAADAREVTKEISEKTGLETRLSILGYIQRGGMPSAQDRLLASRMGAEAVNLLLRGERKRMLALDGEQIRNFDLDWAINQSKTVSLEDLRLAGMLSI